MISGFKTNHTFFLSMNVEFYSKTLLKRVNRKFLFLSFSLLLLAQFSFGQTPATGLSFNRTSYNYVNVAVDPVLNISHEITIEAWINPQLPFGVQDVISKSSSAANSGYIFPRTTDGWANVQFLVYINGQGWQTLSVPYRNNTSTTIALNEWHHLAATYDGYTMKVYIDGVMYGSLNFAGSIAVNNNDLTISGQTGYTTEYFSGKVDDVRIWNKALTQCEISANMSCELSGPQPGLAAYFPMNQGIIGGDNSAITNVIDASGNNLTATLTVDAAHGTAIPVWTDGIASGTCSVFTPISATAGSVNPNLPIGSTIELLASGGGANGTYSWVGPNGFTSNLQNPTITGAGINASGVYTVTVSNGGCSAVASVTITIAERGEALSFDGSTNYVSIPNSPSLNPTQNLTVEAWISPSSSNPTVQNVLSKSTDQVNNGYIFPRTDDGWASFSFWLTINGQWRVISAPYLTNTTTAINLNEWHHLSATYDGFFMKIYLDGVLVNSQAITGSITPNTNDVTLGIQQGKLEFYKGKVDELRIWNRTLPQCEIQNNLFCELNGSKTDVNPLGLGGQTGLAAYYRFNQGLASVTNTGETVLADSSVNGNNGVLIGFDLAGTSSNWVPGKATGTCALYANVQPVVTNNGPVIEVGTTLQMSVNTGTTFSWTGPNNFTSNQQSISIPDAQTLNSGTYTVSVVGNNCTTVVGTNITVAYRAGTLDLDGVNDMVTVPESSNLEINNTITLESWVYARSGANNNSTQDVLCKSSQDFNNGYIFPRTDDSWQSFVFYLHINGQWEKLSAPYGLMDSWHHMAATYDGYYMRIYLDGALAASKQVSGTIDNSVANNLVIGQQPGFIEYFNGQVEESRIWSRALNQCEIINNMNCEVDPAVNPELVAYYKYNQGFVDVDNAGINTLLDATANANNGTLENFGLTGLSSNWTAYKINGSCTVYTAPPVTVSANGTIFGVGSTVKLFTFGGELGTGYSWEGPAGFTSTVQNPNITNAQINQSGVYTVTVPFVKCAVNASTRIDVSPLDPIQADGPTTFCPSSSVTLSTTAVGSAYQWYLDDVLIPGANAQSYVATVGGSYTVSVTKGKDVLVTVPMQLTVVDNLPPVPDQQILPVLHLATPAVVTTVPTATDNCRGVIQGVTNSQLSFDTPGTYTITWTYDDQNGHVVTQDQQVEVVLGVDLIAPTLTVPADMTISADVTNCGAIANFTATATDNSLLPVTITYSQNPGTVFQVGANTITVTATDQSMNVTEKTFVITVLPTIVAPIEGNTVICAGQTTTLTDVTPGGTWSSLGSAVATVDAAGVVTGISAGTATIQYTNACGVSADIQVTVNGLPVATVTAGSATTFCAGGSVNLSVGAVSGNTYQWYNGTNAIANANSATYTASGAGEYTVTVTNSNGCQSTSSATTVTVNPLPVATVTAGSATTFCEGGSVVLTAAGQPGNTYQWYNGANAIANETGASYTASAGGNYTVVVSNGGCQSTSSATTVTVNPLPVVTVTAGSATTFCAGGSVVLTAASQPGNTYQWYNGANAITNETGASYTANAAGEYTVTVTNSNGCQSTSSATTVTVNPLPVATVTAGSATTFCAGGSVVLTAAGQPGNTYQWYNGANAITNETGTSYTASAGGNYTVVVSNGGCQSTSAPVTINVVALPVLNPITGNTTVNTGATTQLSNTTSGGTWMSSNGNATVSSTGLVTGVAEGTSTISYTVTNGNGCSTTVSTVVTVNSQPVCTAPSFGGISNMTVNAGLGQCTAVVTYTPTISGTGTPVISYTFSGATVKSGTGTGSGAVFNTGVTNVVLTATNACGTTTASFTVTVNDITAPVPTVTNLPTLTGQCSVSITLGSSGNHHHDDDDDDNNWWSKWWGNWGKDDHDKGKNNSWNNNWGYWGNWGKDDHDKGKDDHKDGNDHGKGKGHDENNDHHDKDKGHHDGDHHDGNHHDDDDDHHDGDHDNNCGSNGNGVYTISAPTASDNCSGLITGTTTDPLSYTTQGTYLIHWKFDDGKGNITVQTQTVIVKDNIAPVPVVSSLPTLYGTCSVNVVTAPVATDNCAGTITATTTDPRNYSVSGTYTIHWVYNDGNGNTATQNQTVIIRDNVNPVISDPKDVTVNCSGSTDPSVTGTATATDNCSGVIVTYTDEVYNNVTYRTWKATDASGNYSTSVQKITQAAAFTVSINSVPTSSTYTGGEPTNLYLGYGAQSTLLKVGSLPSSGYPYTYVWSGSYTNRLNSRYSASPEFTPTTYGYYTFSVLVTNKYGCTATATISICVTDIRVPGTNGSKVYVCHSQSSGWWWKGGTTQQTLEVPVSQVYQHIQPSYSYCGNNNNSDRLGSCDQTPCNTTAATATSVIGNTSGITKESGNAVTSEAELNVVVMPNPSTTYFTLKFESKYSTPLTLRVMDANGRVVDAKSKVAANSTLQIGANYASGTYYAEIMQGTNRKVVQLIKVRG